MRKTLLFFAIIFFANLSFGQNNDTQKDTYTLEEYNIVSASRVTDNDISWEENKLNNVGTFSIYKKNGQYEKIIVNFSYGEYSFKQNYTVKKCYFGRNSSGNIDKTNTLCDVDCIVGLNPVTIQILIGRYEKEPNKIILAENENRYRSYTPMFLGIKK